MIIDEQKTFSIEAEIGSLKIFGEGEADIQGYYTNDTLDQPGDSETETRLTWFSLELWDTVKEEAIIQGDEVLKHPGAIEAISKELRQLDIDWNGN